MNGNSKVTEHTGKRPNTFAVELIWLQRQGSNLQPAG